MIQLLKIITSTFELNITNALFETNGTESGQINPTHKSTMYSLSLHNHLRTKCGIFQDVRRKKKQMQFATKREKET